MIQEWWKALSAGWAGTTDSILDKLLHLHGTLVGELGLMVTLSIYLALGSLLMLVLWRMVKLSFDVVRCVVIPSAALALVGAWLLPFSFYHILPVTAALFSGLLLLKG